MTNKAGIMMQCELEEVPPLRCQRLTALGLRCNVLAALPPNLAAATRLQVLTNTSYAMPQCHTVWIRDIVHQHLLSSRSSIATLSDYSQGFGECRCWT